MTAHRAISTVPLLVLEQVERNPFRATVRTLIDDQAAPEATVVLRQGDEPVPSGRADASPRLESRRRQHGARRHVRRVHNGETLALANIYGTRGMFHIPVERTVERHMPLGAAP